MLGMVDVEMIRQMNRHHSIREISRMTGWSRQTVRKHLAGAPEPPVYRTVGPRPRPVMDPFVRVVEQWLTAPWGHIAQADFGTAVVMIGHDRREVALF